MSPDFFTSHCGCGTTLGVGVGKVGVKGQRWKKYGWGSLKGIGDVWVDYSWVSLGAHYKKRCIMSNFFKTFIEVFFWRGFIKVLIGIGDSIFDGFMELFLKGCCYSVFWQIKRKIHLKAFFLNQGIPCAHNPFKGLTSPTKYFSKRTVKDGTLVVYHGILKLACFFWYNTKCKCLKLLSHIHTFCFLIKSISLFKII